LQAHPEKIDGIFAANGDMALGAVVAAKDAGRLEELWTIGIDCSPEELSSIRAGEQTACWVWKPSGREGALAVKAFLDGEGYYPEVVSPSMRVDKSNVETAKPAWGTVPWAKEEQKGILESLPGVLLRGDKVATKAATPKNGKNFVVGLSLEAVDHPSLQTIIQHAKEATKEWGWELLVTDGGGDPEKQVAGIEDMVSKGIDLLMVQAAKAAPLKPALEDLAAKNIPFMFVGKPIKGTKAFSLVGPDNKYIGQQVGPWIVEQIKAKNGSEKGNIVVIEGITGDETSVDRIGGAMEELKKYPDIKIVAQQPADYRQPQAVTVVSNILQAHPEKIDGIFAANGDMALGAVVAAKDAGRLGEFWIIGIDCSPEELTSIKAGEETACWYWRPSGSQGIQAAKSYLTGEGYYPEVVAPTGRVDKTNAATSQPSW
jgi:ribose transport system substrate-binding protein